MLLEELHVDPADEIMIATMRKRVAASQDGKGGLRVHVNVDAPFEQHTGDGEKLKDGRLAFQGWVCAVGDDSVEYDDLSFAARSATDLFGIQSAGPFVEVWITDTFPPTDLQSKDAVTFAFNNGGKHGSRRFIPRQLFGKMELKIEPEHQFIQFVAREKIEL